MNEVIQLLGLAASLLMVAQQPYIPVDIKNTAMQQAILAINVAENYLQSPSIGGGTGMPTSSSALGEIEPLQEQPEKSVDIKVNGVDDNLVIYSKPCTWAGQQFCQDTELSWKTIGVSMCWTDTKEVGPSGAIIATSAAKGKKKMTFYNSSILEVKCKAADPTDTEIVSDSVKVTLISQ